MGHFVSSDYPQYRIFEAVDSSSYIGGVEQSHKRGIDLRAALDFLLARDPTRGARKVEGMNRDLYVVCTSDYHGIGVRMCLLYEIKEQEKEIEILAAKLISKS
ncbi:MAG TPA: hypothetical protein VMW02_00880 [Thermoplasmata archaeon]|nr:hypothetical protein [Thermoplasmata archaeon]